MLAPLDAGTFRIIFVLFATFVQISGLLFAGSAKPAAGGVAAEAESMSQAVRDKLKLNSSSPAKQKAATRPDRQRPLLVLLKGAVLSCVGPNVGERRWEQVTVLLSASRRDRFKHSRCDAAPVAARAHVVRTPRMH